MPFQKMAELTYRRLIGNAIQGYSRKAAHRLHLIQTVLHGRITQLIPLLQKIDAQHRLRRNRTATHTGFRVFSQDRFEQILPRDHLIHLGEEALLTRGFLLMGVRFVGKLIWFIVLTSSLPYKI